MAPTHMMLIGFILLIGGAYGAPFVYEDEIRVTDKVELRVRDDGYQGVHDQNLGVRDLNLGVRDQKPEDRDRNLGVRLYLPLVIYCLILTPLFCCPCIKYCIFHPPSCCKKKKKPLTPLEERLREKTFREGDYQDSCSICLDKFKSGKKIRVLPCKHAFHKPCVDQWLKEHTPSCPLCKKCLYSVPEDFDRFDIESGPANRPRSQRGRRGLDPHRGPLRAREEGVLLPSERTEEVRRERDHYHLQVAARDSRRQQTGGFLPSEMAEERSRRAQIHRPHRAATRNSRKQPAGRQRVVESTEQIVEGQTVMLETTV